MIEANGAASLAVTNQVHDACQHAVKLPADFRAPSEFQAPFTLSGLSRVTEPSLSHINSSVKPPSEMRTFGHQRPSRFGLSSRQFTKEEIHMATRQMKKYPPSLAIKEMPKISFLISQFGKK